MRVKVGQRVTRTPKTIEAMVPSGGKAFGTCLAPKPMRGVVVYVHPKGRFHTVEFENACGDKLRECFEGVE